MGQTMIASVDALLRQLFRHHVVGLTSADRIRFQPPDQDWRASLEAGLTLNVYLLDLRENRKLRSNERTRSIQDGITVDAPAPARIDCHYLITAWSGAAQTTEPTLDEHALLYDVTAALMAHMPLVPREIYFPEELPNDFPPAIADAELPAALLPVEGFPKYAEFWGTMGSVHPWKPAVYLEVTLPVLLQREVAGPPVAALSTGLGLAGRPGSAAPQLQIGGTVLNARDGTPARPVPRAWVRLETETGNPAVEGLPLHTGETDALGHFRFRRGPRPAGLYRLRVRAPGLGEKLRTDLPIPPSAPAPLGGYDVQFP
jgi:hypothetical protein